MPLSQDDQLVVGHLVDMALIHFGRTIRDVDHKKFCWFMERAVAYGQKRATTPSQVIEPDALAGGKK